MSASFYDLLKYAKTGVASPDMTAYDKQKALSMCKAGFPVKTLTGVPPISFKSDGSALTAWSISGNMVQTGTPTPTVPIQPEETGDRTGNLVRIASDNMIIYSTYNNFTLQDGKITTTGNTLVGFIAKVDASTEYTVSMSMNAGTMRIREYSAMPTTWTDDFIVQSVNDQSSNRYKKQTFTTNQSTEYVLVTYYTNQSGNECYYIMLNAGSTALDYEPYGYKLEISCGGQTYNAYIKEQLRKIGDYSDVLNSDGTVTRKIYKHIINGTENVFNSLWGAWEWSFPSGFTVIPDAITTPKVITVICSHYAAKGNCASGEGLPASYGDNIVCFRDYMSTLLIKDTRFSTREDFAEYLQQQYSSGTPVTIWYVLSQPKTEQFDAPQIQTVKGANTFAVETTLPPSEVSITGHIKSN